LMKKGVEIPKGEAPNSMPQRPIPHSSNRIYKGASTEYAPRCAIW
jgi:hypothetical protein